MHSEKIQLNELLTNSLQISNLTKYEQILIYFRGMTLTAKSEILRSCKKFYEMSS